MCKNDELKKKFEKILKKVKQGKIDELVDVEKIKKAFLRLVNTISNNKQVKKVLEQAKAKLKK